MIYESREDQFEAIVPFIRQGLEQGERCLYVADENSEAEIREALRDGGVEVDEALESGALLIYTKADTYLRNGDFDTDAMLEFWQEALTEAQGEEGFAGIRAAAEMTWALDEGALDDGEGMDQLVQYEALLNTIYPGEDYVVLCQYNRDRFPDQVLSDVIRSHPFVVSDGMVCGNVHYQPPQEFFDGQRPPLDVGRTVAELLDHTRTQAALEQSEERLQQSKERFERVFESSHDPILIVDPRAGDIVDVNPAASKMLGYSRDELLSLSPSDLHPDEMGRFRSFVEGVFEEGSGWSDELTCQPKTGGPIPAEISASVVQVGGRKCMLAIVRDISKRKKHERFQRRLYEIAADTGRSFEEKLGALVDLGCEYFDLEVGGLARIDPRADLFEVEAINREHSHLTPGKEYPLSETYCRLTAEKEGKTAAVTDPVGRGFEGALCYETFDVQTYLGTLLEIDGDLDKVFFFVSNEPREEPFSEAERTFHHLMGQWVEYELNKKQREKELKEINETLEERVEKRTRQVRELTSRVTMAEQRERERIARILHDGLQQKLYGIQLKMSTLQGRAGGGREDVSAQIEELTEKMEEVIRMTRTLSVDMSPPVLDSDGLAGVLEWLQSHMEERYELEVCLTAEREFWAEEEMRVLLFQVVKELLLNVVKHAGVEQAEVELFEQGRNLVVRVIDEGEGFDPGTIKQKGPDEAFGLAAARERLRPFDGGLEVDSAPGEETVVTVRVPLEKLEATPSENGRSSQEEPPKAMQDER